MPAPSLHSDTNSIKSISVARHSPTSADERIRMLEEQNRKLQQQLWAAQRLTALGELASTTAHEFNNILTTIINYAKMGIRYRDDATRDKALQKIFSAGERAAKVVHSVLGMARNRSEGLCATPLAPIVEDTLVLLERELNKYHIELVKDLADVPPAWANGSQIQQVLLNLLINARQAIGERGEVRISLSFDRAAGTVDLQVRDSGRGIPEHQLPQIFEPFFSTKSGPDASGKGGSGLGLSLCRSIVEAHRGRIRVESVVGKGTAFTIKLPVAPTTFGA